MSTSKRAREMSRHRPETNASEGAGGRPAGAPQLAPSRGCRVTAGRCWTAFTAEGEEKNRRHEVGGLTWPWDAQVGRGAGGGGTGRIGTGRDRTARRGAVAWEASQGAFAEALEISVLTEHNPSAP